MNNKDKGTKVIYFSTPNRTETIAEWAERNKFMETADTVVKKTSAIGWTELVETSIESELSINPIEPPNYLNRLRLKELNTIVIKGQQIGLTAAMEAEGEHSPSRDCLCQTCKLYFRLTLDGIEE